MGKDVAVDRSTCRLEKKRKGRHITRVTLIRFATLLLGNYIIMSLISWFQNVVILTFCLREGGWKYFSIKPIRFLLMIFSTNQTENVPIIWRKSLTRVSLINVSHFLCYIYSWTEASRGQRFILFSLFWSDLIEDDMSFIEWVYLMLLNLKII